MSVPHRVELPGSPSISFAESGITATRMFLTEWDDWRDFAAYFGGGYVAVGDQFYPVAPIQFPGLPQLRVAGIQVEPFSSEDTDHYGEMTQFDWQMAGHTRSGAKVTVTYAVRPPTDGGGTDNMEPPDVQTLSYSESIGFERVTIPGRQWVWDDTTAWTFAAHDAKHAVVVPVRDISYTWNYVSTIPFTAIDTAIGHVNENKFPSTTHGPFAAKTLLFLGATTRRIFNWTTGDSGSWSLEYRFKWRQPPGGSGGWNDHYRESTGAWEPLYLFNGSTGTAAYLEEDFQDLFPGVVFS